MKTELEVCMYAYEGRGLLTNYAYEDMPDVCT